MIAKKMEQMKERHPLIFVIFLEKQHGRILIRNTSSIPNQSEFQRIIMNNLVEELILNRKNVLVKKLKIKATYKVKTGPTSRSQRNPTTKAQLNNNYNK